MVARANHILARTAHVPSGPPHCLGRAQSIGGRVLIWAPQSLSGRRNDMHALRQSVGGSWRLDEVEEVDLITRETCMESVKSVLILINDDGTSLLVAAE